MAILQKEKLKVGKLNKEKRYFVQVAQLYREEICPDDPPTGHEALMLIDNKGKGVIFGLSWDVDKYDSMPILDKLMGFRAFFGRQGFIEHDEVDEKTVKLILNPNPKIGRATGVEVVDSYTRSDVKPIVYDLPYKEIGDRIFKRCCNLEKNPPTFSLIGNNCIMFVKMILAEQGIKIPFRVFPRQVHHAVAENYSKRMFELNPKIKIDTKRLKDETIYYNRLYNEKDFKGKSLNLKNSDFKKMHIRTISVI